MFTASENEIKKHNSVKSLQEKFQNYLQCPKGFFFHESIPGSGLVYCFHLQDIMHRSNNNLIDYTKMLHLSKNQCKKSIFSQQTRMDFNKKSDSTKQRP